MYEYTCENIMENSISNIFFLVMHRYFKIFHHFFIFCEDSQYKMILLIQKPCNFL